MGTGRRGQAEGGGREPAVLRVALSLMLRVALPLMLRLAAPPQRQALLRPLLSQPNPETSTCTEPASQHASGSFSTVEIGRHTLTNAKRLPRSSASATSATGSTGAPFLTSLILGGSPRSRSRRGALTAV